MEGVWRILSLLVFEGSFAYFCSLTHEDLLPFTPGIPSLRDLVRKSIAVANVARPPSPASVSSLLQLP